MASVNMRLASASLLQTGISRKQQPLCSHLPQARANWYSLAGIADDRARDCLGARVVRILLVNIQLVGRSGTEVVCCETARGLRRRGHDVAIYIRHDGPPAEELRAEGFHVTNDLSSITQAPDVIQANQTFPLVEAIGRFPATPAISICHDATVWFNEPLDLPTIRRHVAVDFACRDRIASAMPNLEGQIENSAKRRRLGFLPAARALAAAAGPRTRSRKGAKLSRIRFATPARNVVSSSRSSDRGSGTRSMTCHHISAATISCLRARARRWRQWRRDAR